MYWKNFGFRIWEVRLKWKEQAGKWPGTPQWVEQAGKGGKRKLGRLAKVTPSAPPLSSHMNILAGASEPQRGALGIAMAKRPSSACPLPSLFNLLARPKFFPRLPISPGAQLLRAPPAHMLR